MFSVICSVNEGGTSKFSARYGIVILFSNFSSALDGKDDF